MVRTLERKGVGREVFLQARGTQDCTVAWPPGRRIVFFLLGQGLALLLLPLSFPFQFQIIPQFLCI